MISDKFTHRGRRHSRVRGHLTSWLFTGRENGLGIAVFVWVVIKIAVTRAVTKGVWRGGEFGGKWCRKRRWRWVHGIHKKFTSLSAAEVARSISNHQLRWLGGIVQTKENGIDLINLGRTYWYIISYLVSFCLKKDFPSLTWMIWYYKR